MCRTPGRSHRLTRTTFHMARGALAIGARRRLARDPDDGHRSEGRPSCFPARRTRGEHRRLRQGSGDDPSRHGQDARFLMSDAAATPAFLSAAVKEAVDGAFNALSVDGDTSTNDTVLLLASGKVGGPALDAPGRVTRAPAAAHRSRSPRAPAKGDTRAAEPGGRFPARPRRGLRRAHPDDRPRRRGRDASPSPRGATRTILRLPSKSLASRIESSRGNAIRTCTVWFFPEWVVQV